MNLEQLKQEQERVSALLEGVTEGEWVIVWLEPARIKTGAGIIEVNGSHSYADFHLMAESQRLARAYLAALDTIAAQQAQLAQALEREQELKALQDFLVDEGMAYRCESCQRFLKEEDVLFDCYDVPLCQEHYEALEGGRL